MYSDQETIDQTNENISHSTLNLDIALLPRNIDGFSIDVKFCVPPGITALLGPSGAGKSTILASIAGLIRPHKGYIALGNKVWFDSQQGISCSIHQREVSLVFQSLALFPHLNAEQNVAYGMDRSLSKTQRCKRACEMLERMHVVHLAKRKPATFSGGEAQRVALARAFARKPRLVLLDEAFSAMDTQLRQELSLDVRVMITDMKIPAVLVTHNLNEALTLAEHAVLLEQGHIIRMGNTSEVLSSTTTSAQQQSLTTTTGHHRS